jgi:CDGSH-type Zn-finger protein
MVKNLMALCKCGLSEEYPECNGTHNDIKNENLRQAILEAYRNWEKENS